MANWDESKHPRDNDGKFGSGGGGGDAVVKFDGDDDDALAKDLAALRANASVEQREQGDAVVRLVKQYGVGRWSKMDTQTKEREIALEVQRGRRKDLYSSLEKQVGTGEARDLLRTVGLSDIDDYRDRSAIKRKAERLATLGGLKFDADSGKFLARNNMMIFYGDPIALNWAAEDGAKPAVRVQLSPFGEFTLRDGGKRSGTVQHCSRAAFEAMVANWKAAGAPDVLVDVDHASATGGSTEAAAWAKNLRVEDDGLCADFELTPKGRALVEGRSYRFVSPGWTLADDGTPVALCSVALTNRPNLPVKPVVNADDAGGRDPDDPNNGKKGNPEMDLKKIAAALGLPETATEDEVIAAIASMKDAQAQAAEEAANAKAEEFAANAVKSGKIAESSKDAVKAAYRSNPEVAEAMLNSVAAQPKQPLPDFGKARQPQALNAAVPGKDADPVAVYNAYVAMPDGADKDAYLAANAAKIEEGYAKSIKK